MYGFNIEYQASQSDGVIIIIMNTRNVGTHVKRCVTINYQLTMVYPWGQSLALVTTITSVMGSSISVNVT